MRELEYDVQLLGKISVMYKEKFSKLQRDVDVLAVNLSNAYEDLDKLRADAAEKDGKKVKSDSADESVGKKSKKSAVCASDDDYDSDEEA